MSKPKSRAEEARRLQERVAQLKPLVRTSYTHPMDIPIHLIPEGWTYRYIRKDVFNEPDDGHSAQMANIGWDPVPASRHPELAFKDLTGRSSSSDGYIYYKGGILCEMPTETYNDYLNALSKENQYVINNMKGTEEFMNEPAIPARLLGNQAPIRSTRF